MSNIKINFFHSFTGIHEAIENDRYTEFEQWLNRAGRDINERGASQYTPLIQAAWKGRKKMAELLIQNGADIDLVSSTDGTALWWACNNGHQDCASVILDSNPINLDATHATGTTALHEASEKGFSSICSRLVSLGADISIRNESGKTALDVAKNDVTRDAIRLAIYVGFHLN